MATFDATQVTSLAEIFGVDSQSMSQHLDFWASTITDADKTSVLSRIDAYKAIEDDNVEVQGTDTNFGANIQPGTKRSLIKTRIAGLIHLTILQDNRVVRC